MKAIPLLTVEDGQRVLQSTVQPKEVAEKETLKRGLKNVIEITAGGTLFIYVLGFYAAIIPSTNLLNNPCNTTNILMQQLIEPHQDIITEMLRKLPFGTASNLPERDQFIGIRCEKIGKFMKFLGKNLISLGI